MSNSIVWSGADLSAALGVKISTTLGAITGSVQFNSQDVCPGDIFIALSSSSGKDAHDFVEHALEQGAIVAIVSKLIPNVAARNIILVDDTDDALLKLAHYRYQQLQQTKFIGVTGSVGKTSLKEIMSYAFSTFSRTFASRKNFNNFLGVKLNLASVPLDTEYAIFELGMSRTGEISQIVQMLPLDIAVINNIDYAHTEFFDSMQQLVAAKCEIFTGLKKNGLAIINTDDSFFKEQIQYVNNTCRHKILFFGTSITAHSRLLHYHYDSSTRRSIIKIKIAVQEYNVDTRLCSYGQALNITAALLVGASCNFDLPKLVSAIRNLQNFVGRGKICSVIYNNKRLSIIDDCYNANPKSMQNALQFLSKIDATRKVAILGDMLELGSQSLEQHFHLAEFIKNHDINGVIAIGALMSNMYTLLPAKIKLGYYESAKDLLDDLPQIIKDQDYILIKGSNRMRLRSLIELIYKNGETI